ncbi:HEAT repeat domain-containing protein [Pontibacter populi]|uniref:HEAT repeat domain-containing protein n=1 Tax=Pontibacter populi TaxID=890055 RepID=A0ABV1RV38_9BACT
MALIDKLATSLNRRDEEPNKQLAQTISEANDESAIKELVGLLHHKDKNIQSDVIKVLNETGKLKPELVVPYIPELVKLLRSKNNRMVWGAMAALSAVAPAAPTILYKNLNAILDAAAKGSVITKDHANKILVILAVTPAYTDDCIVLLLDQLKDAPVNQLPTYAENTATIVTSNYKPEMVRILTERLPDITQDTKRKRLTRLLQKLQK